MLDHILLSIIALLIFFGHIPQHKKNCKAAARALKRLNQVSVRIITTGIFYLLKPFPKRKNLIVFGADAGNGFAGNSKYLFLEALKHPEIQAVWITKNRDTLNVLREKGYEAYMAKSRKGFWMQLRAATAIMTHSIKDDFWFLCMAGAVSVNLWHGVGLKCSWFRNKNSYGGRVIRWTNGLRKNLAMIFVKTNMTAKKYVVSTSENVSAYYPDTYNVPVSNIFNLGQTRNDVLFDDSLEEGFLPDYFKNQKVITYMPTHRNYGKNKGKAESSIGNNIDYQRLSEMLQRFGYIFIVKHHRFLTGRAEQRDKFPNVIDITQENYNLDSQMILKYTDILITDYSSCYTDYLLLDRPVIFFCYDLEEYLQKWDLNFEYDTVTPGPKVFDFDQLMEELEKILQGQDDYRDERQRVKRIFYSPENQQPVAAKQMEFILNNIIFKNRLDRRR
ncbi:MAG: CDP-glycerol glycerophosphotransferase family protein [Syntrophomonadaceae bacterium]|jgi:CDP-glycerol glycerophosphotransferase (TagB/SpsB family)|nr:CDP-glycerol glycerophosphotransferase family protein [Syntrophomonadaceae bacterium]